MLSSHSISPETSPKRLAAISWSDQTSGHIRTIVGIEKVRTMIAVAGEMILGDPLDRRRLDVLSRVETMIERANEHVVDVEQYSAIRFVGHRAQKIPLAHR